MSMLLLHSCSVLLLVQACGSSLTVHPHPPDPSGPSGPHCSSCSMARPRRNEAAAAAQQQQEVVEAVKRHILNMLHLQERPNVTRPVPRAALLNAIRKLHVGHVGEDGSVLMDAEPEDKRWGRGGGAGAAGETPETSEVITFAETGDSPDVVDFTLSRDGGGGGGQVAVDQAEVWLFLRLSKSERSRARVTVSLYQRGHQEALVSEKKVDTRRSGWHTFPVAPAVRALLLGAVTPHLSLRVSCPLCADAGAAPVLAWTRPAGRGGPREQSHRPFLMVGLRQDDDGGEARRRRKRGLECDGKVRVCCKRQFYVNFKDIGWSDWIIAPSGYHANYCEGECPSHVAGAGGSSLSFHSTVINHYRLRGYAPFQSVRSCCVPTRLRAMSMLYYNEEQKIIKKDIQNMIVEDCGCS